MDRRWRAIGWTAASDGAANGVFRSAGTLIHWADPIGLVCLMGFGIGTLALWSWAVKQWVPALSSTGPKRLRNAWSVMAWGIWAVAWAVVVWAIIGTGYALRQVVSLAILRLGMIAAALLAFSALGMIGTVALVRGHPPFGRRAGWQPGRWLGYWVVLTAIDTGVLMLAWWMGHRGWGMQEWGGGLVLAWSIAELSLTVSWAQDSSRRPIRSWSGNRLSRWPRTKF